MISDSSHLEGMANLLVRQVDPGDLQLSQLSHKISLEPFKFLAVEPFRPVRR